MGDRTRRARGHHASPPLGARARGEARDAAAAQLRGCAGWRGLRVLSGRTPSARSASRPRRVRGVRGVRGGERGERGRVPRARSVPRRARCPQDLESSPMTRASLPRGAAEMFHVRRATFPRAANSRRSIRNELTSGGPTAASASAVFVFVAVRTRGPVPTRGARARCICGERRAARPPAGSFPTCVCTAAGRFPRPRNARRAGACRPPRAQPRRRLPPRAGFIFFQIKIRTVR